MDWNDDSTLSYRGKKYNLIYNDKKSIVFSQSDIYLPKTMTKKQLIHHHATLYLPERCLDIAGMMGLNLGDIKIRKMKSVGELVIEITTSP